MLGGNIVHTRKTKKKYGSSVISGSKRDKYNQFLQTGPCNCCLYFISCKYFVNLILRI